MRNNTKQFFSSNTSTTQIKVAWYNTKFYFLSNPNKTQKNATLHKIYFFLPITDMTHLNHDTKYYFLQRQHTIKMGHVHGQNKMLHGIKNDYKIKKSLSKKNVLIVFEKYCF